MPSKWLFCWKKNKHNEAVDVGIPQTLTSLVLENKEVIAISLQF